VPIRERTAAGWRADVAEPSPPIPLIPALRRPLLAARGSRGRREIDPLRLPLHLAHHWGSASAEIPPLERLTCRKNASKVRAENARYRLKPYASTSRKDGSPNVRGCCFERFSSWGDLADLVLHRRGRLTSPHHQEHAGRTETLRLLGYRFGGQLARTPPRPSRRRPPVQMIACVPPNQTGAAGWSEGHNNSAPLTKRRTSRRLLPSPWGYSPQLFGGRWHCSIIASIASSSTAI